MKDISLEGLIRAFNSEWAQRSLYFAVMLYIGDNAM